MSDEDKKRVKDAKKDWNLHVALIERDGLGRTDAIILAYAEGKSGLGVRLLGDKK